jgi:death-on-curing family protein
MKYLNEEDLIRINKSVLNFKQKKADSHSILKPGALHNVVEKHKTTSGDTYDIAADVMRDVVQAHPFASGNKRSGLMSAATFLHNNKLTMNKEVSKADPNVLIGVKENYYTHRELRDWLQHGDIRRFKR